MSKLSTVREYVLRNSGFTDLSVIIEPWAEEFNLEPGSKLILKAISDEEGRFEIEVSLGDLSIWLWSGCRAEVALDGIDQKRKSLVMPVP